MSVFELYCYCVSTLSVVLNGILLLISSHKSIEAIQELRYFLSNVAVAGGCFSICLLLLQPQMVSRGSMTIRVPHGPAQYFSETFVKMTASLSIVFYLYGTLSYPLFFIYRSMILSNSTTYGQYFNRRNLLATFVIIFVFCCLEGACLYYSNVSYENNSN
ncbi:hypothetical protein WR25_17627 [Diploscapter pachys]|uniref:G-protein coupled receptors family 1 profile domain-containing protein n=1 Tax=Diploscapter pachys TaxID=2018661 RepID=A0A2A2KY69_9BILA|nr:hypothetical protein WR25_17627 [Diploscapter pachys]